MRAILLFCLGCMLLSGCIGGYRTDGREAREGSRSPSIPRESEEWWPARLTFSPDSRLLVASGYHPFTNPSGRIRAWDACTGQMHWKLDGDISLADGVTFMPASNQFVTQDEKGIHVWNAKLPKVTKTFHTYSSRAVAFSPGGEMRGVQITGTDMLLWNKHIRPDGYRYTRLNAKVLLLRFSANGRRLVTLGKDGSLQVWDADTGKLRKTLAKLSWPAEHFVPTAGGPPRCLAISPDGSFVAVGGMDYAAKVWDLRSGKLKHVFPGHSETISSLAFAPDSTMLVCPHQKGARLWSLRTGKLMGSLTKKSPRFLCSIACSPDGKLIAGGGGDTMTVWDAHTYKIRWQWQSPPPPGTPAAIAADTQLPPHERVRRIASAMDRNSAWQLVLAQLRATNEQAASRYVLTALRDPALSREDKLALGRSALQDWQMKSAVQPYAAFLVDAILHGGVQEFRTKGRRESTAIGEYAFIASNFDGYKNVDFTSFKDPRVVPALIQALKAPDAIGPQTGYVRFFLRSHRNVPRQLVPLALVKLQAKDAIAPMRRVLFHHYDAYLRWNCAYALAYLMDRSESIHLEKALQRGDRKRFLFPFGAGLLAKKDPDGLAYMRFDKLPEGDQGLAAILYSTERILNATHGLHSPRCESLYRYLLQHQGLRNLLLFDTAKMDFKYPPARVPVSPSQRQFSGRTEMRVAQIFSTITEGVVENNLQRLIPSLTEIARHTKSRKVRAVAERKLPGYKHSIPLQARNSQRPLPSSNVRKRQLPIFTVSRRWGLPS